MFSEVRSRIQTAVAQRNSINGEVVTESEIYELKVSASSLRKQLQHIVDDEIASNNEARGVATNGMVLLRNELDEKKVCEEGLREKLHEAKEELKRVEKQCIQEEEARETCREDMARMQEDTDMAQKDIRSLRAEIEQSNYFQENVDTETMHRLRADVQNLMIERERDEIRMRELNNERYRLISELSELKALKEAHDVIAKDQEMQLSEAKMTKEMYTAHHETLALHLESLGGDPRLSFSLMADSFRTSFRGLFKGHQQTFKDFNDDTKSIAPRGLSRIDDEEFCNNSRDRMLRKKKASNNSNNNIMKSHQSDKSKHSSTHNAVGGIVLGADVTTGEGSSDFLRKLPTIFKMGDGNNNENIQEYVNRREREVEFEPDSHSISAISAITIDEDAWTESESDESS